MNNNEDNKSPMFKSRLDILSSGPCFEHSFSNSDLGVRDPCPNLFRLRRLQKFKPLLTNIHLHEPPAGAEAIDIHSAGLGYRLATCGTRIKIQSSQSSGHFQFTRMIFDTSLRIRQNIALRTPKSTTLPWGQSGHYGAQTRSL